MYMAIADADISQTSMKDSRFNNAGWFSILGAVLFYPAIILALLAMSHTNLRPLLFIEIPLAIFACVLNVYVFFQLKRLVNERYFLHNINILITLQIVCYIVLCVKDIFITLMILIYSDTDFVSLLDSILGTAGFLMIGIVGILFGVGLLRIHDDSAGLLRTYAIISIIAACCFISVILFPIGIFLGVSNSVILGAVFFKAAESDALVEFV